MGIVRVGNVSRATPPIAVHGNIPKGLKTVVVEAMMEIIGSLTSPFTRIVRVLCVYLCLDYKFTITPPFGKLTSDDNDTLALTNPLMKVPVLRDGESTIFDSRIISNYLITRYAKENHAIRPVLSVDEDNMITVILGVIDAGILIFMLRASYHDIDSNTGYIAKLHDRMTRGLAWLDTNGHINERIGLFDIALICGLDWFTKRNVINWREYSHLVAMYNAHCNSAPFINTSIPSQI